MSTKGDALCDEVKARKRTEEGRQFSRGILGHSEALPRLLWSAVAEATALTTHTPGSVCSRPNLGGEAGRSTEPNSDLEVGSGRAGCDQSRGYMLGHPSGLTSREALLDHDPHSFPVPYPDPQNVLRQGGQFTAHPAS